MNRDRLSLLVTIIAIVAVLALSWTLGVAPQLRQAEESTRERQAAEQLNQVQTAKLAALATDRRDAASLKAKLARADAALPARPDLSRLLGELNTLQDRYQVHVTGYTASDAQPFGAAATATSPAAVAPTPAAPTPAATPAPSGSAATSSGSAATSSGTAAPATSPGAATGTATGTSGLYSIPVQVQATGSYADLTAFVGALQSGPRTFVVDKLTVGAAEGGSGFSATIAGFVYVLHAAAGSTSG